MEERLGRLTTPNMAPSFQVHEPRLLQHQSQLTRQEGKYLEASCLSYVPLN